MQQVEIRIKRQINRSWSDWFGGFEISPGPHGGSILTGHIRDQAELQGVLSQLADLGLELISVNTLSGASEPARPTRGGGESITKDVVDSTKETENANNKEGNSA